MIDVEEQLVQAMLQPISEFCSCGKERCGTLHCIGVPVNADV